MDIPMRNGKRDRKGLIKPRLDRPLKKLHRTSTRHLGTYRNPRTPPEKAESRSAELRSGTRTAGSNPTEGERTNANRYGPAEFLSF